MKYYGVIFLLAAALGCTSTNKMNSGALTGKLVVSELCGHYVVQIISGKIDTAKIAANWHDDKRNTTYGQAVAVANPCSFEKSGIKEGDTFTFTPGSEAAKENCMQCMAYYPTPSQSLQIENIKKITP